MLFFHILVCTSKENMDELKKYNFLKTIQKYNHIGWNHLVVSICFLSVTTCLYYIEIIINSNTNILSYYFQS